MPSVGETVLRRNLSSLDKELYKAAERGDVTESARACSCYWSIQREAVTIQGKHIARLRP